MGEGLLKVRMGGEERGRVSLLKVKMGGGGQPAQGRNGGGGVSLLKEMWWLI